MKMRRRGLSLVEVLIAIVLLGIVGAGITRMLSSQLRFFARGANARDARAVSRNALILVRSEMRMIEPNGIVAASADSLRVRLPYAMGLYCASNTATFVPVDSLTWAQAQYGGYAWRTMTTGNAYTYVTSTTAPAAAANTACTGVNITPVPGGRVLSLSPAFGTLAAASPVLLWQQVTYRFANSTTMPGRRALWRQAGSATAEEVAVPVDATSRFNFYTTGTTSSATVPSPVTSMRGVEIILRGESERTSPGQNAPEESLQRVAVFFRNAVQ